MALLDQGFKGPIYPVNPGAGTIDGLTAYARITDIPGPVDLVIVLVPQGHTLAVVPGLCGKRRQGNRSVYLGLPGNRHQRRGPIYRMKLLQTARAAGIRIIGPNGMGLYCPETGSQLFFRSSPGIPALWA